MGRYSRDSSVLILKTHENEYGNVTRYREESKVLWDDVKKAAEFIQTCTREQLESRTNEVRTALKRQVKRED
jgi:hypothetical protein